MDYNLPDGEGAPQDEHQAVKWKLNISVKAQEETLMDTKTCEGDTHQQYCLMGGIYITLN